MYIVQFLTANFCSRRPRNSFGVMCQNVCYFLKCFVSCNFLENFLENFLDKLNDNFGSNFYDNFVHKVHIFWVGGLLIKFTIMFFFDIIVNFIVQKLKSKHTSLKKYTNWAKLIFFLSFLREWEEKKLNISHLFCCIALIRVTAKVTKDIKKDNIKNSLKTKNDFRALPNGAKGSPEPQWDESLFIKWVS